MITQLKGRLVEKSPTDVVIDCNGVGYMVHISLNTFSKLTDSESITLFTHLQVKEDSNTLFGFYEKTERNLFRQLISVSGIGASTARTMLSSLTPKEIQSAIISGNVSTIQSVKGIGLKTAQRVIIDLKDKVSLISGNDEFIGNISNTNQDEALSALEVLGYSRKHTNKVIETLLNNSPEMSVEELIKSALNKL
ncbi:MAG: Holliday junction branch migration protein RuvA [Flavobacteriaceae bacterium]|jgi:Holliday junction DNA helicase RuvA|nr:Holliday junction branch migration protein RuvA [Flavobacteriaceae bacterium]MBT5440913.1 Holliday junction branch migration protein RuvA [Candidatus Neomarinimicrobiota bacterium]MBT4062736.1 Holliday junction branch migration protein RuvA [Flavobacteriaceae bacterium]MBT4416329.1 Holliday junction branch migration protein RuvA [Flavobacteriaceae bacterium]MBT6688863.1 Holliday junction branch migration protein RuvA [Flavobacteriaceae bacterium]|tara:strand:+ start:2905 stop:3486 length:582 start_codon:yes stop_codon:yes gene_type:complete